MRTTSNALCDFTVYANDAEIGRIKDIYFDDESWDVRYLVVDTRRWLPGRKVLLAPRHVAMLDPRTQVVRFDMTRDQLKDAPSLDEHLPVTRSHEIALHDFFGWTQYWTGGAGLADLRLPLDAAGARFASAPPMTAGAVVHREGEPHLESCKDLQGFAVQAIGPLGRGTRGARIGELWDFVISYVDWNVPFFVVEEELHPGTRKFVLATELVTTIDTSDAVIRTQTPPQSFERAPGIEEVSQLGAPG